jgi:hypothetical protein
MATLISAQAFLSRQPLEMTNQNHVIQPILVGSVHQMQTFLIFPVLGGQEKCFRLLNEVVTLQAVSCPDVLKVFLIQCLEKMNYEQNSSVLLDVVVVMNN